MRKTWGPSQEAVWTLDAQSSLACGLSLPQATSFSRTPWPLSASDRAWGMGMVALCVPELSWPALRPHRVAILWDSCLWLAPERGPQEARPAPAVPCVRVTSCVGSCNMSKANSSAYHGLKGANGRHRTPGPRLRALLLESQPEA